MGLTGVVLIVLGILLLKLQTDRENTTCSQEVKRRENSAE
jgi:hypothetical protein